MLKDTIVNGVLAALSCVLNQCLGLGCAELLMAILASPLARHLPNLFHTLATDVL
jgi:hypothetical protein